MKIPVKIIKQMIYRIVIDALAATGIERGQYAQRDATLIREAAQTHRRAALDSSLDIDPGEQETELARDRHNGSPFHDTIANTFTIAGLLWEVNTM
jgi:hypothetical protein